MSQDGKTILYRPEWNYGDPNGAPSLHLFDGETGKLNRSISGENGSGLYPLDLSVQGHYIFASSVNEASAGSIINNADFTLSLWDAASGTQIAQFTGQAENPESAGTGVSSFSDDESSLLTLSKDRTHINVWSTSTGRSVQSIAVNGTLMQVRFRPKHSELLVRWDDYTAGNEFLSDYDISTGKELFRRAVKLYSTLLSFDTGGNLAFYTEEVAKTTVWDLNQNSVLMNLQLDYGDANTQFPLLSPDGTREYLLSSMSLSFVDVATQKQGLQVANPDPLYTSHVFQLSPDGKYLSVQLNSDDTHPATWAIYNALDLTVLNRSQAGALQLIENSQFIEMTSPRDMDFRKTDTGEVIRSVRLF